MERDSEGPGPSSPDGPGYGSTGHGGLPELAGNRTLRGIGVVVLIGVVLLALIVWRGSGADSGDVSTGAADYPRGPHGARLLSDGALRLEMTIYEEGVPPHFRIYPYDAELRPVPPGEVDLRVELHRLGGRVDSIRFRPEADYLLGDAVVEEPHSFDVRIVAQRAGQRHEWTYAQLEGKVQLGPEQLVSAGIEIGTVGPRQMLTIVELPAEVRFDDTRLAHVVPRLPGVVTEVLKREGDRVGRGELLAVLSSRELADAKRDYLVARQRAAFLQVALGREEELRRKLISAERDLLEARQAHEEAVLAERLAAEALLVLGLTRAELAGLASAAPDRLSRYEIRAPLAGEVIARNVTVGEAVAAAQDIFTVADLSSIWVDVTVYAKDLGVVRAGQAATVHSVDLQLEAAGRVSYLGPLVGQDTRAAIARIVLPNPGGRWRPGLFVTVRLIRSAATVPLAVPIEAIQTFRDWQVVFVRHGDWFEARPLELGRRDGEWVEVLKGLAPGEQYAAVNSFAVKAEIGKLGASHDH